MNKFLERHKLWIPTQDETDNAGALLVPATVVWGACLGSHHPGEFIFLFSLLFFVC
jgi:hypothetical protein